MPSRRSVLAAAGLAGLGSFAGCAGVVGRPAPDDPPPAETPPLDAERQVYGSDGQWSSFGCNAGNTRSVHGIHAGEAPVDDVTEQWRVPVSRSQLRAPIVADGRVFLPERDGLRVLDAESGAELWRAQGVETAPVVRDGTVYVADRAAPAVRALSAADGTEQWTTETTTAPAGPSMYPGQPLLVGVGERIVAFDPATGAVAWERGLFGRVLDHPPIWQGYFVAVATDAGEVAVLTTDDGRGHWRVSLPAPPTGPPSADSDAVYVTCRDGVTYALGGDSGSGTGRVWSVDTGWTPHGLGIERGLVVAGTTSEVHAVDSDSGAVRWRHALGDWRHTAPAFGRDTLFVGGDRLWALDPTAGSELSRGPAVRFERSFHGRVGPGPVLNDGTLYVVAETGPESAHLLALA
ncbi:PQQ-binding-like beta-propeller repeat protein [Salinirubrum litoreum]|uniref:PQQ-binding-like beta-propeller repeat protein n=1 Tax=Salinirubrum litoreum TaxID=1126234 RepID=A0ABD5RCD7_9EURY|nr:PQQ-binding-like beta-propeller repeat protein [Salinirubrum litoreum]